MQRRYASVSVILLLIAAWIIFDSSRYDLGTVTAPGPGLFPMLLGVILFVLSLLLVVHDFRGAPAPFGHDEQRLTKDWRGLTKFWFLVVTLVAYALMLEPLGFIISSFICMSAMFKIGNSWRWPSIVLASVVSVGIAYIIFLVILRVPLPRGYWA